MKNLAYGRQRISQPMRIVGQIQFLRGCMVYQRKRKKKKMGWLTRPRVDPTAPRVDPTAPRVGDGRYAPNLRFKGSTRGRWTDRLKSLSVCIGMIGTLF